MSFFGKIFGGEDNSSSNSTFWKNITSEADLDAAIQESFERKVVIFKHSTRCFISKTVLNNFEKEVKNANKDVSYYFLDLLAHRSVSNKIVEIFDIIHQSPQMIVLENGKAVKDASHQSISLSLV